MSQPKALIIEDDPDLLRLYAKTLRNRGYEVREAPNLDIANAEIQTRWFHVVICDMLVGNEFAIDMLKERFEMLRQSGTRVAVVTSAEQFRTACDQLGVDIFVTKPISIHTLTSIVAQLTHP